MGWGWWFQDPGSGIRSGIVMSSRRHGTLSCWSMSVVLQVFLRRPPYLPGVVAQGKGGVPCFFFCIFLFFLLMGEGGGIECWQRKKNKARRVETQFPLLDGTFNITRHSCLTLQPRQESASPTTTHHDDLTVIPGLIPQVEHMGMPSSWPLPIPGCNPVDIPEGGGSVPFSRMPCGR